MWVTDNPEQFRLNPNTKGARDNPSTVQESVTVGHYLPKKEKATPHRDQTR